MINYVIALIVFTVSLIRQCCAMWQTWWTCDKEPATVFLIVPSSVSKPIESQEFEGPWVTNAAEQKYKCDLIHCSFWCLYLTRVSDTSEGDDGFLGPTRLTRDPLWQRINSICGATTPGGGPWQHHLRSLGSRVLRSCLHVALLGWQSGRLIFKQFHSFWLTRKKQYEQEDNHVGEWMHILRCVLVSRSLVGIGTLID